MVQKKLPTINSAHGTETRNIINGIIKTVNDRGLEILSESGFLTWLDKNGIKHREEVDTVADLPSSDSLNTVRGVAEENKIYIKKENGWLPFQSIDISKINELENKVYSELAQKPNQNAVYLKSDGINVSDWDEETRRIILDMEPGNVNAVLGEKNVKSENLDDQSLTFRHLGSELTEDFNGLLIEKTVDTATRDSIDVFASFTLPNSGSAIANNKINVSFEGYVNDTNISHISPIAYLSDTPKLTSLENRIDLESMELYNNASFRYSTEFTAHIDKPYLIFFMHPYVKNVEKHTGIYLRFIKAIINGNEYNPDLIDFNRLGENRNITHVKELPQRLMKAEELSNYVRFDELPEFAPNQSKWAGKVWNVLGDSNTEVNIRANTRYHDIISNDINCEVNNYGSSGIGYMERSDRPGVITIADRIENTSLEADLITVLAGGNNVADIHSGAKLLGELGDTDPLASYYGALDNTFKLLVNRFPTKTIAALSQFKRGEGKEETIQLMVKALKDVCGKYGIPVLDLYNGGNVHAYNQTFIEECMPDGVHLNDEGHKMIANKIKTFIESL